MAIGDILARILSGGGGNRLSDALVPAARGFIDPNIQDRPDMMENLLTNPGRSTSPAPMQPQPQVQPQMGASASPMGQAAPQPASGGGVGDFLGNMLMPQRTQRNQTVQWLQGQGMDEGTATLLAGNKNALQQYLLQRTQGASPEYDFMNIDGTLVRTDKRTGQIAPMGQFGADEEVRPMSPTERLKWGIPQDDKRPYAMTPDGPKVIGESGVNVTTNVGGEQTPGWKKIDESFADTYLSWQSGGFADSVKQLDQLDEALGILESGQDVTGTIGLAPDILQPFINERGTVAREAVEEVVQRNLREILGAQFTEREGERLISRAFNPRLRPEENAKRVRRLIAQVAEMAKAKQAMVDYFDENGTLRGYTGPRPSKSDLDKIDFGDDGPASGLPEGVSEEDLRFTMEKHGLTREEVLERINAR